VPVLPDSDVVGRPDHPPRRSRDPRPPLAPRVV